MCAPDRPSSGDIRERRARLLACANGADGQRSCGTRILNARRRWKKFEAVGGFDRPGELDAVRDPTFRKMFRRCDSTVFWLRKGSAAICEFVFRSTTTRWRAGRRRSGRCRPRSTSAASTQSRRSTSVVSSDSSTAHCSEVREWETKLDAPPSRHRRRATFITRACARPSDGRSCRRACAPVEPPAVTEPAVPGYFGITPSCCMKLS